MDRRRHAEQKLKETPSDRQASLAAETQKKFKRRYEIQLKVRRWVSDEKRRGKKI
jgi:hypothetical protein